jgi:phosphate transport system permease protein
MKEIAVVQDFENNLDSRNRKGIIWHVLFQASTIVGIIALIALMLNVIDSAFGYVAYEARVDPDSLTIDGISVEDQSKEQLVALLQSTLSSGAYNKLDNEKPLLTDHARKYFNWSSKGLSDPR